MPEITVKGKKKHLKYPANWAKMSSAQKAAYIKRETAKLTKKPKKKK